MPREEGEVKRVLVVGARPGSIGAAVAEQAAMYDYDVVTAGMNEEDHYMDLVDRAHSELVHDLIELDPTHVVCTVGINKPEPVMVDTANWYRWHFDVNVTGPMRLLKAWQQVMGNGVLVSRDSCRHFAAISSNSASVPRSDSAAYCASKAALSQALRVKAREGAGHESAILVYGYEPGLVAGTPMTADTVAQFGPGVALTRMRDPRLSAGISADALASLVVHNLTLGPEVNGVLFRLDADER